MRRFWKIYFRNDPFYGTLLSAGPIEQTLLASVQWVGLPDTKQEFVDQINNFIISQGYQPNAMFCGFRMVVWSSTQFANNNPDFSGYSAWEAIKKVSSNPKAPFAK